MEHLIMKDYSEKVPSYSITVWKMCFRGCGGAASVRRGWGDKSDRKTLVLLMSLAGPPAGFHFRQQKESGSAE